MGKRLKEKCNRITSLFLAAILILSGVIVPTDANTIIARAAEVKTIASAEELPKDIPVGTTYELTDDITLSAGQQIASVAGVLDGKGHTITLADKPLAANVTGTIQNIIVEGNISSSSDYQGSIVTFLNGGTILNSASKVKKTLGFFGADGGIVGRSLNGKVYNSYFAGSVTGSMVEYGGIIGQSNDESQPSIIKNCYYNATKENPVNFGHGYNENEYGRSYAKKSVEELKSSADLLNSDIRNTGFIWTSNGSSLPYLVPAGAPVPKPEDTDFTKLQAKVDEVKALNKDDYTADTWGTVAEALASAEEVLANEKAGQDTVNKALKTLEDAVKALKKQIPLKAVALPKDGVISITKAADLGKIGEGESKYYRLENDITIKQSDFYMPDKTFNGVFDGNGHKVTFDNPWGGLFKNIGENGVVQNVEFDGELDYASVCEVLSGAVINCLSTVSGSSATGLVKRLSGGVISNCVAVGKAGNGALIYKYGDDNWDTGGKYVGKIYNSYWIAGPKDPAIPAEDLVNGSKSMNEKEMQSKEWVNALNTNRGDNGKAWGQSGTTGFPYFGVDEDYNPGTTDLPKNKYKVSFGKSKEDAKLIENQTLKLSRNDLVDGNIIGQFFIEGAESKDIEWSVYDVTDGCIDINKQTGNANNGKLHIFKDGEGIVKGKVKGEDAIWVKVIVDTKSVEDFKIYINNKDVTNGKYTVEGSSWVTINVKARYEGEEEYKDINSKMFTFEFTGGEELVHHRNSSELFFNKPGTSKVTVKAKDGRTVTVEVTSTYVPVESIEPDIAKTNVLHNRASMGDGREFDWILTNGVIITPENASNKEGYTITSSNKDIAEVSAKYYIPYKQGEVTFTAEMDDVNPTTGEVNKVKGHRTVTFTYKNPLTKVTAADKKLTVKAYEKVPANLSFEGELSKEGWSVTEPELIWTYSKDGIVDIRRDSLTIQKEEEAVEGERGAWIATTDYYIEGLKPGVVTATGTPLDKTNNVEPVVLTIKVEAGEEVDTNTDKLAETGRNAAGSAIKEMHADKPYAFGDEWDVYSLTRSGAGLTDKEKNDYYNSIVEKVKDWDNTTKPTDISRVMLALSSIDKDVKNVGGVDLEKILINNEGLKNGSNEYAYALIALKAAGSDLSLYTKNNLVEGLITFQNADGGFTLFPGGKSGIDTTAIAIQALGLYRQQTMATFALAPNDVETSINNALEYLKKEYARTGLDTGNSESTSQVIIALTTLGIDLENEPGFVRGKDNLVTVLMKYYVEGEGFIHTKTLNKVDKMATVQAFQALESFRRFKENEPSYWEMQAEDFTPSPEPQPVPKPTPKPEPKPTPKPEVKPVPTPEVDHKPVPTPEPQVTPESKPEVKPQKKPKKAVSKKADKKDNKKDEIIDNACTAVLTSNNGELTYTIKIVRKDEDKLSKLNLKINSGSSKENIEENISKLAKEPLTFHFNTKDSFDADLLIEMEVDMSDGEYVLMSYNEKEEKLELVQKVEVKSGKTKFVVNKGVDYCITEKASSLSLKDMEGNDSPIIPLAVVSVVLIAAAGGFAAVRVRRKKK